jgi:hypothetical protein
MPPRVNYLGPRVLDDGSEMHVYVDDGGREFGVPKELFKGGEAPALPQTYEQNTLDRLAEYQALSRADQEAKRTEYNELAASSQRNNTQYLQPEEAPRSPVPAGLNGATRPVFPDAQPYGMLRDERLLGPRPDGSTLSDRPGVQQSIAVDRPNSKLLEHERQHAAAIDPAAGKGPLADKYYSMGPRGREQFRVVSALEASKAGDDGRVGHYVHEQGEREQRMTAAIDELARKLGLK